MPLTNEQTQEIIMKPGSQECPEMLFVERATDYATSGDE